MMKIALNEQNLLVNIEQATRGLACQCFCFECGEAVIAKKGEIKEHHFAHANNKESCNIRPESILHKYAKQVIMEQKQIYLPALTNDGKDKLWQFHSINAEQSVGNIRPDLVAIGDDDMIFIEVAVTSFIDDNKLKFIKKLGIKTIEIDLSAFLNQVVDIPNEFIANYIINHVDNKTWVYPTKNNTHHLFNMIDDNKRIDNRTKKTYQSYEFKIQGYWVTARLFESGMLALKSVYNLELIALFKAWGGSYNGQYKTWNYFKPLSDDILKRLNQLHESVD